MATQLWYGRRLVGYEAEALQRLQRTLDDHNVAAHLLASFEVGGHEIDLLVVKPDGIFLTELKQVGGPVYGAVNGLWTVQNGEREYPLHGGTGENPYQQMRTQYRVLTEWLEKNKAAFLLPESATVTCFRPRRPRVDVVPRVQICSLLAFYPALPPGSQLDIQWPVEPVSFPDLAPTLRRPTKRVNLAEEEIVAMAEALHLTLDRAQPGRVSPPADVQTPHRPAAPRLTAPSVWLRVQLLVVQYVLATAAYKEGRLLRRLAQETDAPDRPAVLAESPAVDVHPHDLMLASVQG